MIEIIWPVFVESKSNIHLSQLCLSYFGNKYTWFWVALLEFSAIIHAASVFQMHLNFVNTQTLITALIWVIIFHQFTIIA